eukprot:3470569-Alexandrium_andersonii.AAC.1
MLVQSTSADTIATSIVGALEDNLCGGVNMLEWLQNVAGVTAESVLLILAADRASSNLKFVKMLQS